MSAQQPKRKEEKLTLKKNKEDSTAITIKTLTLKGVIDLYLTEVIEDRVITDQRTGAKINSRFTNFKRPTRS